MTARLRRRLAALEANRPPAYQERIERMTDAELAAELEAAFAGCDPAERARLEAMSWRELDQEIERLEQGLCHVTK